LEFDLQSGDVVVIENQKRVRTISIKDDNPYGALKDITIYNYPRKARKMLNFK